MRELDPYDLAKWIAIALAVALLVILSQGDGSSPFQYDPGY
jgi:hypothetical protein